MTDDAASPPDQAAIADRDDRVGDDSCPAPCRRTTRTFGPIIVPRPNADVSLVHDRRMGKQITVPSPKEPKRRPRCIRTDRRPVDGDVVTVMDQLTERRFV